VAEPNPQTDIAKKEVASAPVESASIRERDGVQEAVLGPLFPLVDPDSQRAMVPVEESVEEAGVGPMDPSAELQKRPRPELSSDPQAQSQDFRIQDIIPSIEPVVLDQVGIIQCHSAGPPPRYRVAKWMEVQPAPGAGDWIEGLENGKSLGHAGVRGDQ
jgi:hypothetical protein